MKKLWKPALLLAAVAVMVIGMLGSGAWFTDLKSTTNQTITAGTLILDDGGFASIDLGDITKNMAPGDVSKEIKITIKNAGTLPLGWFGNLEITGGTKLREAIYVDYGKMEFFKPDGTNIWEPTDNFIVGGRGSGPYPGEFNRLADLSNFKVITLNNWDDNGSMTPGFPYEHMGALNPNYSYVLTLKFGFAEGAGNEYQGDKVSPIDLKFVVNAVQINPKALDGLAEGLSAHYNWMTQQVDKQK